MIQALLRSLGKLILNRGVGSQFGEDTFLATILPRKGVYVDVGCYHPHLYSNTYRLYKSGWRGTAVDPNPDMWVLWRVFRRRDTFINAAVGSGGHITYYRYSDGAYNGFELLDKKVKDQVRIQTVSLTDIIPQGKVDFLNIDAEGMDKEILQSYDWHTSPEVIAVEGDESDELLRGKGYHLLKKLGVTSIYSRAQQTK